jgi:patatin-like phospholipase/acyl hydrolase
MSEGLGHNCPHCRELLLAEDFKLIESYLDVMKSEKQKAEEERAMKEIQRQKDAASQAFRDTLIPPPIEINYGEPIVEEVQETSKEEVQHSQANPNPVVNLDKNVYYVKVNGVSKHRSITKDVLKQVFIPLGKRNFQM